MASSVAVFHCAARIVSGPGAYGEGIAIQIEMMLRDGKWYCILRWDLPGGRPDAEVLDDICAELTAEVTGMLVARYGVQGLLT